MISQCKITWTNRKFIDFIFLWLIKIKCRCINWFWCQCMFNCRTQLLWTACLSLCTFLLLNLHLHQNVFNVLKQLILQFFMNSFDDIFNRNVTINCNISNFLSFNDFELFDFIFEMEIKIIEIFKIRVLVFECISSTDHFLIFLIISTFSFGNVSE